ncbi:MAG: hypothetical protein Ta2E_10180 [Mycoplasmoidaceae bacterium]|nr:MAG: hypothetical protein Ta2E_10180 [Mycoplasmoidaceae bacterium]
MLKTDLTMSPIKVATFAIPEERHFDSSEGGLESRDAPREPSPTPFGAKMKEIMTNYSLAMLSG